jgi:hypothetical protein
METNRKGRLALELKPSGYALFVNCPGFRGVATHIEVGASGAKQSIPVVLHIAPSSPPVAVLPASEKDSLAEEAVARATGAALQANAASAVKILLRIPASTFAGEDAEWRSCMIDRFGPSPKPVVPVIDDSCSRSSKPRFSCSVRCYCSPPRIHGTEAANGRAAAGTFAPKGPIQ